jgi:tRNA modification GTPase
LAAHQAAERTADQADLVLWVHAADMPCLKREAQAAARFPPARCLLVWSKVDAAVTGVAAPVPSRFSEVIRTSAATGMGLTDLRDAISRRLTGVECSTGGHLIDDQVRAASAALARAQSLVSTSPGGLAQPELVAIELRTAYESISEQGFGALVEDVLARVFSQFCVGK